LPKSVTESRIISNLRDLDISDDDFKLLNQILHGREQKRFGDPYHSWDVDVFGLH
jgi:hypothetical protein